MGSCNLTEISMKSFTAIILACAISAISAEITCQECLAFTGNMEKHLSEDEIVATQVEILVGTLCPQAEDIPQCEATIKAWWPKIAAALFPVAIVPESVCAAVGLCEPEHLLGAATCQECVQATVDIANIIKLESQVKLAVDLLKGDILCTFDADPATCVRVVDILVPYAVPVLSQALVDRGEEHCCEFSPSKICC